MYAAIKAPLSPPTRAAHAACAAAQPTCAAARSARQAGLDENKLQRQPHIVLLDLAYYRAELLPVFAECMPACGSNPG